MPPTTPKTASGPCTGVGERTTSLRGQRRRSDVADVVEDGAGGRGDDADAAGEGGQGALAALLEEAFLLQLLAQQLELGVTQADALGLDEVDDDLELAAGFVDGDAAVDDDLGALCQVIDDAGRAEHGGAEQDAAQLSVFVFEGEVGVAGGLSARAGDLAGDPDVAEDDIAFEELAEVAEGLGDGENLHDGSIRVPWRSY